MFIHKQNYTPKEIVFLPKAKLVFLIIPIIVFLAACNSSSPKHQKIVRINIKDDPHSLDPRIARDPNCHLLIRMFFEGLTRVGPHDRPELALADTVKVSEDLKTYIFTLREAYWSNGDPVVAEDFVYAWRQILSPQFPSDHAFQLYILKNGKGVKEGTYEKEELGVKAVDERTLLIDLEYPLPYALEVFAAPYFSPVNQKWEKDHPDWAKKADTYVSNGPFILEKWAHNDLLVAKKNDHYWDKDSVRLEGIEMVMVSSDVELKLFEKNELDWCGSPLSVLPLDALKFLKEQKRVIFKPRAETAFLRTNTEKPLLNDSKFRHILALSLDRQGLVDHVIQGAQLPATSLVPPSMHIIKKSYFQDRDFQRARELFESFLNEKGLNRGNFPKLTLTYINSERTHLIAQVLQQQWFETIGIRIALEAIERKVFFDRISRQEFDLAFCSWGADVNDPINFLEVFKYRSQSTNNTQWEDLNYARMLNESSHLFNPELRAELLSKSEEILMEAMPIIPIFHYTNCYMKSEQLNGAFISSLGNLDFKWATLENGTLLRKERS